MDETKTIVQIPEPPLARFLFADTRMAIVWLIVRILVGWQWLYAGWEKLHSPAWVGSNAGAAIKGFIMGALKKTAGEHPDVQGWYAHFLGGFVSHHAATFSYIVTFGEIFVGIALILGLLTGLAAFFGTFMNLNYLFAGTVSTNPILLLFQLFLIMAWRIAGWIGVDRWLLPDFGTPWQPGKLFKRIL